MRRLLFPLMLSTALIDCQSYQFRHITRVSVEVDTVSTTIAASPGTAYIMIVQDISGSMCEPINHDAGLATTGAGANDCAADLEDSKAGIVASSMQEVLAKLNPKVNSFDMGLIALPDVAAGDGGNSCGVAPDAIFPIDDAQITIPEIVTWYQSMPNLIGGGTPTAATLLSAANDPQLVAPKDPKGRRYVLLITDGLPNCDDLNPCVLDSSAPQYLWTDGEGHGCESPSFQHANAARLGELTDAGPAEPPAECQCSQGSCPDPTGDAGGNIGAQCCVVDPYLLIPPNDTASLLFGAEQCLDSSGTIKAVQQLADAGITTYVIGMGFDYTNPIVLNEIAQAGDPRNSDAGYYQASDPTSLYDAINTIIQNAIPRCNFTLSGSVPVNPALIQVKLNGDALSLNDQSNGFAYDADAGEIDLLGSACDVAKDGDSNQLSVSLVAQP